MICLRSVVILICIGMLSPVVSAGQETGRTVVIHVKSVPGDDEGRFFSMVRLAIAGLERGNKVAMVFDGKGARSVRLRNWYGGDTSLLDRLDLTPAEQETLAPTLGLTVASMPDDYGDLLRLLRGKGVELYVSSDMIRLHGIKDEELDNVFVKAGPAKMLEILDRADIYISY